MTVSVQEIAAGDLSGSTPAAPRRSPTEIPGPSRSKLGWRGNALRFFRNPVGYMSFLYEKYGEVVRLSPGSNDALFFRSTVPGSTTYFAFGPERARELLSDLETFQTRAPRGPKTRSFERLSTNVFFINGPRHKQQRDLFRSAFSRNHLKTYHEDMVACTERMLDRWANLEAIELDREMTRVNLEISSKTLYGLDVTRKDETLALLMSDMIYSLFSPLTMIPLKLPGSPYSKLLRKMDLIIEGLEAEIENKRQAGADGADLLSMMVRLHDEDPEQLTADELIGEAFTMFFAGHDTASKALTWTLFLLAQHPEVQAELLDELEPALGGGPPSYEQIYQLPVLDRVVKESLRLMTPAIAFTRETTRPAVLGDYEIPTGSEVIYSPYVIHTDPAIYSEPKKFRPDRWLDMKPSAYEYLPFGVGARTCMGAAFGGMQLRLMVALIVQRCRLKVRPGAQIDLKTNVVIAPKPGIPMTVHSQDREFAGNRSEVQGYIREMVDFDG